MGRVKVKKRRNGVSTVSLTPAKKEVFEEIKSLAMRLEKLRGKVECAEEEKRKFAKSLMTFMKKRGYGSVEDDDMKVWLHLTGMGAPSYKRVMEYADRYGKIRAQDKKKLDEIYEKLRLQYPGALVLRTQLRG